LVLPAISGADPASDVLQPFVIAGELDLVSGLSCAAAIDRAQAEEALTDPAPSAAGAAGAAGAAQVGAGGSSGEAGAGGAPPEVQSRLRVRGLPAIPAGTLNGGRSYLLVATGCLGGSGYNAPNSDQYCGMGYSERQPTVSAVFVALSRATSPDHVGLQVLHASLATDNINVTSGSPPPSSDSPISIVTMEVEGGLLPRPAYTDHTAFDYGSARGYRLEVVAQNAAVLDQDWAGVLARGGIGALEDGSNYALVLIGPRPGSKNGGFWNLPAITVVASDPTRQ
ncbi:MAG TPA: hypothetical protein VNW92_27180, partial [Polyangiaceae bacterium]|nr:hypothetical protein [Polyangiaceae bacterium]